MRKEIQNWWKQALEDFDSAKVNFNAKKYYLTSFLCQQAVEKALKAFLIKKELKLIKTHDLVFLAKILCAPIDIIKLCKVLAPVYIETRYPGLDGTGFKVFSKRESEDDIKSAERIIKWIKGNL